MMVGILIPNAEVTDITSIRQKKGKVPVPFHGRKDIPVGTLTNILKQDGLEKMHFRKD